MNNCKEPNDSDLPKIERALAAYATNSNDNASADDLSDNRMAKKGIETPGIVWDFKMTGMVYNRNGNFVKLSGTLLRDSESRSAAIMFFFANNYKTQCLKIQTAFDNLTGAPTVFILKLEFDGAIKYSSTHGCTGIDIPFEGNDCHCVTPVPMVTFLLADDSPSYVTLQARPELLPYHDSNGVFQITPATGHDDSVNKFAGIYLSSSKLLNGKLVYLNQANDRFLCLGGVMANGRVGIRWVLAKGITQLEKLWTETSVPEWTTQVGQIEILSDVNENGETSAYDLGNESLTPDGVTWGNYEIARIGGAPLTAERTMPFQHMMYTSNSSLVTGIFQFAKFDSDQDQGLSFFFAGIKRYKENIYKGMFLQMGADLPVHGIFLIKRYPAIADRLIISFSDHIYPKHWLLKSEDSNGKGLLGSPDQSACAECWNSADLVPYAEWDGRHSYTALGISKAHASNPFSYEGDGCLLRCQVGYWSNYGSVTFPLKDLHYQYCISDNCKT